MKTRINKDGKYYGKVLVGYKPNGVPIYTKIVAGSAIELWKQHYLLKNGITKHPQQKSEEED